MQQLGKRSPFLQHIFFRLMLIIFDMLVSFLSKLIDDKFVLPNGFIILSICGSQNISAWFQF